MINIDTRVSTNVILRSFVSKDIRSKVYYDGELSDNVILNLDVILIGNVNIDDNTEISLDYF